MMYRLIRDKVATKFELEEYYTLSETLKLYALIEMQNDIQEGMHEDSMKEMRQGR